jgi:hypothetical protein
MENWYNKVNDTCAEIAQESNIPVMNVVGAMAALSPIVPFKKNLEDTVKICAWHSDGANMANVPTVCTVPKQRDKAIACLSAKSEAEILQILGGLKTTAFFLNILHPDKETEVCIDLWMLRYFGWKTLTAHRKRVAFTYLKDMGKEKGILPHQMQAILWCELRGAEF